MNNANIGLEAETFDALIELAKEAGIPPEQFLEKALEDASSAVLSEIAISGFQKSLRDNPAFYAEL